MPHAHLRTSNTRADLGLLNHARAILEDIIDVLHHPHRQLLVISELYRQKREMMEKKTHAIADRIVSIEQPHVRPIVRGKAGANVEFDAKIAACLVDGYAWIETVQWVSFNEATTLQVSVEAYKQRCGYYPAVILADKIYRNRDN